MPSMSESPLVKRLMWSGLLAAEPADRSIVLDLKDLVLVDREAVRFLCRCEGQGIALRNCPPYIREWVDRERARTPPTLSEPGT